jgi:hypothetical protein
MAEKKTKEPHVLLLTHTLTTSGDTEMKTPSNSMTSGSAPTHGRLHRQMVRPGAHNGNHHQTPVCVSAEEWRRNRNEEILQGIG